MLGSHDDDTVFAHEQGGWYVLSGATRLFPLGIDQQQCLSINAVQLTAHVLLAQDEAGDTSHASFPVDPALCQQITAQKTAP